MLITANQRMYSRMHVDVHITTVLRILQKAVFDTDGLLFF